jgi:hypothetical protein
MYHHRPLPQSGAGRKIFSIGHTELTDIPHHSIASGCGGGCGSRPAGNNPIGATYRFDKVFIPSTWDNVTGLTGLAGF